MIVTVAAALFIGLVVLRVLLALDAHFTVVRGPNNRELLREARKRQVEHAALLRRVEATTRPSPIPQKKFSLDEHLRMAGFPIPNNRTPPPSQATKP
jgi:hypothetical protein